jgi:membrane protein DedA with SNARE-associated domain
MGISHTAYTILDTVTDLSGVAAYATIVGILFICGLGVPIPEDITLLAAGLLSAWESISFPGALVAGFTGVILGDSLLFFMGRRYGKKVFALPGLRRVFTPERVLAAEARIRKNGPFICFIARFLPGLRTPIFAMSGALGVKPSTFLLLDGVAALISVPIWVSIGYWVGKNFDEAFDGVMKVAKQAQMYLLAGIFLVCLIYVGAKLLRRRVVRRREQSMAPSIAELNQSHGVSNGDT